MYDSCLCCVGVQEEYNLRLASINMRIKSVNMLQEDTDGQSRLRVELQQFTPVATQLTTVNIKKYSGRVAQQAAAMQNLGKIQGKTMSTLRSWVSPSIVPYMTGVN